MIGKTNAVVGGSSEAISRYVNPTWWDIESIFNKYETDNRLKFKSVFLLTNLAGDEIKFDRYSSNCKIITSDGQEIDYSNDSSSKTFSIFFDKSKDKPCYIDGEEVYGTRYMVILSSMSMSYEMDRIDIESNSTGTFGLKHVIYIVTNDTRFNSSGSDKPYLELIKPINDASKLTSNMLCGCSKLRSLENFSFERAASNDSRSPFSLSEYEGVLRIKSFYYQSPEGIYNETYDMYMTFANNNKIKKIIFEQGFTPRHVGISSANTFYKCQQLREIIGDIDLKYITNTSDSLYNMFGSCTELRNVTIKNLNLSLTLAGSDSNNSYVQYGKKLTVDCLINTCKECIKQSSSRTLTISSDNLPKLANVYVKFTDSSQTEIAVGEKGDVVVCESTDDGAMTIENYMLLKDWTLK